MVVLDKRSLPASMDKSTLAESMLLMIKSEGKSIPIIPVALLGRDSDGCGVLSFVDADGALLVKGVHTEVTQEFVDETATFVSDPIDVGDYCLASIHLNVTTVDISGGSVVATLECSNDGSEFVPSVKELFSIADTNTGNYGSSFDTEMGYRYIRVKYTPTGASLIEFDGTQIICAKSK